MLKKYLILFLVCVTPPLAGKTTHQSMLVQNPTADFNIPLKELVSGKIHYHADIFLKGSEFPRLQHIWNQLDYFKVRSAPGQSINYIKYAFWINKGSLSRLGSYHPAGRKYVEETMPDTEWIDPKDRKRMMRFFPEYPGVGLKKQPVNTLFTNKILWNTPKIEAATVFRIFLKTSAELKALGINKGNPVRLKLTGGKLVQVEYMSVFESLYSSHSLMSKTAILNLYCPLKITPSEEGLLVVTYSISKASPNFFYRNFLQKIIKNKLASEIHRQVEGLKKLASP